MYIWSYYLVNSPIVSSTLNIGAHYLSHCIGPEILGQNALAGTGVYPQDDSFDR